MSPDLSALAEAIVARLTDHALLTVSTGAGMSRESGIPTFRGEEGVWRTYRAEDVATPEAFRHHPRLFWEFNDHLRQLIHQASPHAGHVALAELQQKLPPRAQVRLITQNIDRLHEEAGSTDVIHLHGDIIRVVCPRCGFADDNYPVPAPELPPVCECGRLLRPDIVLFGEALPADDLEEAFALAETCDVMLVVGTSVNVQPAASLPFVAREHGALVVEINPEATILTGTAAVSLRGAAGEILPPLVEAILAAWE
ncbi:NAD-dependent deacylase [bacterium]|nr:NAD-dependent deacylase [bacterium]